MLVEYPHDLRSVHSGAAAERDDNVGLEGAHSLGAPLCGNERRIGLNVGEGGVGDAHFVELIGDRLGVAVLVKEGVGDEEGALFAHNVPELLKCDGHAALLDINLFGRSEPKHVLSPLSDRLDIEQVLHADVLGNRVAAP